MKAMYLRSREYGRQIVVRAGARWHGLCPDGISLITIEVERDELPDSFKVSAA